MTSEVEQLVQHVDEGAHKPAAPSRPPVTVHRPTARLFVFARHAVSTANDAGVLNSDPARPAELTARGRAQARQLGAQIAGLRLDFAVVTRFPRTQQTAELALEGLQVPIIVDPGFDEIRSGAYDGAPIEDYWAWSERHSPSEHFPLGESPNEAQLRYASALRRLLSRKESVTLVVLHELALRRIAEAATPRSYVHGAAFGNATPYMFDEEAVARAAARLASIALPAEDPHPPRMSRVSHE
jgi:probable phosphoglycerate mutase